MLSIATSTNAGQKLSKSAERAQNSLDQTDTRENGPNPSEFYKIRARVSNFYQIWSNYTGNR